MKQRVHCNEIKGTDMHKFSRLTQIVHTFPVVYEESVACFALDHNAYHDIATVVLESQTNVALFSHSHDIYGSMGTGSDSPDFFFTFCFFVQTFFVPGI